MEDWDNCCRQNPAVDPHTFTVDPYAIVFDPHAILVDRRVLSTTFVPDLHKEYVDVLGLGIMVVFAWESTIIACRSQ